jgi:hypothetical protein
MVLSRRALRVASVCVLLVQAQCFGGDTLDVDTATHWLDTAHSTDQGPNPNSVSWTRCASEGELCDCTYQHSAVRLIRYGSPARSSDDPDGHWQWDYAHAEAMDDVVLCHPVSFMHRDPAPGLVKHCECAHDFGESVPAAPPVTCGANDVFIPADRTRIAAHPPPPSPDLPQKPPPKLAEKMPNASPATTTATTAIAPEVPPGWMTLEAMAPDAAVTVETVAESMADEIVPMGPEMQAMATEAATTPAVTAAQTTEENIAAPEMELQAMSADAATIAVTAEHMVDEISAMAPEMQVMADEMQAMAPEAPEIQVMASEMQIMASEAEVTAYAAEVMTHTMEAMAPEMGTMAGNMDTMDPDAMAPEMNAVAFSAAWTASEATRVESDIAEMAPEMLSAASEVTAIASSPAMHAVAPAMADMAHALVAMATHVQSVEVEATRVAVEANATAATATARSAAETNVTETMTEADNVTVTLTEPHQTTVSTSTTPETHQIPHKLNPNEYKWKFCARDGDAAPCVCDAPGVLVRFGSTGEPSMYANHSAWFEQHPLVRRFDYASLPGGMNGVHCGVSTFNQSDPFPSENKVRGFPNHHVPPLRLPILVPEGRITSAHTRLPD